MHYVLRMKIVYSFEQLVYEKLYTLAIQTVGLFLQNLQQVSVHELKYQVEATLTLKSLNHFDYRFIFEHIKHLYFPLGCFLYNLVFFR